MLPMLASTAARISGVMFKLLSETGVLTLKPGWLTVSFQACVIAAASTFAYLRPVPLVLLVLDLLLFADASALRTPATPVFLAIVWRPSLVFAYV